MPMITVRRPILSARVAAIAAASLLLIGLLPSNPATANGGITSVADVEGELCPAGPDPRGGTAALTQNVRETGASLTIADGCVAVLDLNGKTLEVRNVVLGVGSTLTVRDTPDAGVGKLVADASGASQLAGIRSTGANLIIQGGVVEASGGGGGAGIGGDRNGDGGTVTISGGEVTATGGFEAAGIGGGDGGIGGAVVITGGKVSATGDFYAAGIGGGWGRRGGAVTISGGEVHATGGAEAAGIGGGYRGDGGTVSISGGEVIATGGREGAGIGGGLEGDGATVTISGGTVLATAGSDDAQAIGAGERGSPGTLTLGPGAVRIDSSTDAGLPVTSITFTSVSSSAPAAPSFYAPGGVQPSQPVATAAFIRADGSAQQLAASVPGPNQVRYAADGIRITLRGGAGTDAARGLVANPADDLVCEVCIVGLAAGQVIEIWLFSTPRLVAAHLTDDAECQLFTVPLSVPLDGAGPVSAGAHTLQLTLSTANGLEAVNVGLTVGGPVPGSVPAGEGPATPFALVVLSLVAVVAIRRIVAANA
jgi:hypothetical protein